MKIFIVAAVAALSALSLPGVVQLRKTMTLANAATKGQTDWPVYGGSSDNIHYSKLTQINTSNVAQLKQAWSFDTGETGGLETSPIIVDGVLYAYTPSQKIFALDAATGKLLWKFTAPGIAVPSRTERSLAYWREGNEKRLIAGVANFVYALDPDTGKSIPSFGTEGRIDLRENLRGVPSELSVSSTSPGAVYKDLIIFGSATPEQVPAPPGDIRAYDVRNGKMRWIFHTIPHPGEYGYDTWPKDAWTYSGAANNWCGMTVDTKLGIVFVPTGSAATDWYGADRLGDNLFANTLIALDAATGKRIWHFQGVKHDIWDRDFPSPPALVTVKRDGKEVPAVVQTSKQGYVFVFKRSDGTPLFPIEYRKFPSSTMPGEVTSDTQPIPLKPAPLAREFITEDTLTNRTPEAHAWAVKQLHTLVSQGPFIPNQSGKETLMFPGADGGAEWGGPAFDPATHILYINSNEFGMTNALVPHVQGAGGRPIYLSQCSACHQSNLSGSPPLIPSLVDVGNRLNVAQITDVIQHGRGRMPAFAALKRAEVSSLAEYLVKGESREDAVINASNLAALSLKGVHTYDTTGYHKFLDPDGYPANSLPWGTLNAIDLNTGEYLWKIPFGSYPDLTAKGVPETGSENYGGPIVTDGGVLFIGATVLDKRLHAFDKATGKLLWKGDLPYSANATPATYEVNGRQYVVIACGGDRDPTTPKKGGIYVAFALPQ